jgi:TRAP-type C4-dicarboxylate transport system permease small subunit
MKKVVTAFVRVVDRISVIGVWVGAVGVFYLMVAGMLDVILRNTGLPTIPGSYEFMEAGLVCVAYFSVAYVQMQGGHVDTDMVTNRLSDRVSRIVRAAGIAVALAALIWTTWAAIDGAILSTLHNETKFGVFNFPLWPGRIVVAVGLVLLTIQVAITLGRLLTDKTVLHEAAPLHVGV